MKIYGVTSNELNSDVNVSLVTGDLPLVTNL